MPRQRAAELCFVRQTIEKGLGLFAKVDLLPGTIISKEVAVKIDIGKFDFCATTWERPDFWESYRLFGAGAVERMMSAVYEYHTAAFERDILKCLSRSVRGQGLSDATNLFLSNCVPAGAEEGLTQVVFGPVTCTINHSCIPNASLVQYDAGNQTGRSLCEIVALKRIPRDTEIMVQYSACEGPTPERRQHIQELFRFHCLCEPCKDGSPASQETWNNIGNLRKRINVGPEDDLKRLTPWRFFWAASDLNSEYKKLGIEDLRTPELLEECAAVAAYHSDAIRTSLFMKAASIYWSRFSHARQFACEPFIDSPSRHELWGRTEMGLSRSEDQSLYLGSNEFNNRVTMVHHKEESYDRFLPKEEARQKAEAEFAERERSAQEAANELLTATTSTKMEKPAAPSAAKLRRKKQSKKPKGKQEPAGGRAEATEATREPANDSCTRLNTMVEREEDGAGREMAGGEKGSRKQSEATPIVPMAGKKTGQMGHEEPKEQGEPQGSEGSEEPEEPKETKETKEPHVESKGPGKPKEWQTEQKKHEEHEELKKPKAQKKKAKKAKAKKQMNVNEEQKRPEEADAVVDAAIDAGASAKEQGTAGEDNVESEFSVSRAAIAGEVGALRRLRSFSQPPPLRTATYDVKALVLRGVGRGFSELCAISAYKPSC